MIWTDRSRIEMYEKCPRARYLGYEYDGRGLVPTGERSLKLDARIGTWTHNGIEQWLEGSDHPEKWANFAAEGFTHEISSLGLEPSLQLHDDIVEGGDIVKALVYAWIRTKGQRVRDEGEVLAIEEEMTVDFQVGGETVRLMARPDILWLRHSDGQIYIRNLKTVREPDNRWTEKWPLDMQTLSEVLAVDHWLDELYENKCNGVIIDGLVTGRVSKDRESGLYYHANPLIYAWYQGETEEFHAKYEWHCTGPHKFSNGRKCMGGMAHKLSKARRVRVESQYPGGIVGWIDNLLVNDPSVVEEMLVELPPIIRSEYQVERWKRMVLPREAGLHGLGAWAAEKDEIDYAFPMHTSAGNCLFPGKCQFFDICHGSSGDDPLNSGYQYRVPNHKGEVLDEGQQ